MHKRQIVVSLGGGLGNQLFQFAALQQFRNTHQTFIECGLLHPRIASGNSSEAETLDVVKRTGKIEIKIGKSFLSKLAGYLISRSSQSNRSQAQVILLEIARIIFTAGLLISTGKRYEVYVSNDLGFTELNVENSNYWLIGYFQSYKYITDEIVNEIKESNFDITNTELIGNWNHTNKNETCLIHLRLGDYLTETKFGLPSKDYYVAAINHILSKGFEGEFWIISDDLEHAKERLAEVEFKNFNYVDTSEGNSIEVLKLMSSCSNFIIANSTFSYWSAILGASTSSTVIAPKTWFTEMREPRDLIPKTWCRIDSEGL